MQKRQSVSQKFTYWLKVVSLGIILGLGLQFAQAYSAPTVAPPGGNVSGPVTTGSAGQIKSGNLSLNSDGVYANALLIPNGNVGVGVVAPTQKLDVNGRIRMATQTTSTDAADIVATKGYVDGKVGGTDCVAKITEYNLWCPATPHGKITKGCAGNASSYGTAQCWNGDFIVFMTGSESGG